MEKLLKFRLVGENMTPEKISSNEFARLISAYEDALITLFEKQNPDKKNVGFISVVGVKNESAGIQFKPNYVDEILVAANTMNNSINNNTYNQLPFKTVERLSYIQNFVNSHNCIAELNGYDGIASTKITTKTNLYIDKTFYIKGETTIYGKIVRIGGSEPRVRLEFDDGKQLSLKTKESEAKMLSPYLYETIGVKGLATWKKENYELEGIVAQSFIIMDKQSNEDKFKGLGDLLGKYWIDIKNPDEYVNSLRT